MGTQALTTVPGYHIVLIMGVTFCYLLLDGQDIPWDILRRGRRREQQEQKHK
jgi:hypothetical protein